MNKIFQPDSMSENDVQFEFLMRVTRVRQTNLRYTVISALVVQENGRPVARAPNYSVVIPANFSPVPFCQGQRWRFTGRPELIEFETIDGWKVQEMRFTATSAILVRTSGSHIVSLLCSEQFPGVGPVTAQRAWDELGESLYDILDRGDYENLASVVGDRSANVLISGWTYYNSTDLLRWMQTVGLDVRIGRKVLKVYGTTALNKLQADPYRLLALGLSWQNTDVIATTHMSIAHNDARRLAAAVESELYSAFDAGDTYIQRDSLKSSLTKKLNAELIDTAIDTALNNSVVLSSGERIYAPGPNLIEKMVCTAMIARLKQTKALFNVDEIDRHIAAFEKHEQQRSGISSFLLNEAQRQAIHMAATHGFFCIIGGAGVGKTTTLNALVYLIDISKRPVYLLAPTGKASKRMSQATGKQAMTIAGFLRNVTPKGISDGSVIVVDEASMLDIRLAYQLLTSIPSTTRLILIGDSAQLPPVGPGLTLHVIAESATVPLIELTEVKRFAGHIADMAGDIRCGKWYNARTSPEHDVCFIACSNEELPHLVVEMYLKDPLHSQVLCCTRASGAAPAEVINRLCQEALGSTASRLLIYSNDRQRIEDTGLRKGDPIICNTNLWEYDLQNGSLGRLEHIEDPPIPLLNDAGDCAGSIYGWISWDDGERRPLTEDVLDVIELAYAITVHKSQGSEVPTVIIPVYKSRNLDRTMLYTAITRAKRKVIMLGDIDAARRAVEAQPHVSHRKVMLGELLTAEGTYHV